MVRVIIYCSLQIRALCINSIYFGYAALLNRGTHCRTRVVVLGRSQQFLATSNIMPGSTLTVPNAARAAKFARSILAKQASPLPPLLVRCPREHSPAAAAAVVVVASLLLLPLLVGEV